VSGLSFLASLDDPHRGFFRPAFHPLLENMSRLPDYDPDQDPSIVKLFYPSGEGLAEFHMEIYHSRAWGFYAITRRPQNFRGRAWEPSTRDEAETRDAALEAIFCGTQEDYPAEDPFTKPWRNLATFRPLTLAEAALLIKESSLLPEEKRGALALLHSQAPLG